MAGPDRATENCGRLTESIEADAVQIFSFWLVPDQELAVFYAMKNQGIVSDSRRDPATPITTFSLHAKRPEKVRSFRENATAPAKIDRVG